MKTSFSKSQKIVILITALARLSAAFLILKWPLFGIITCMIIDCFDFGIYLAAGIRVDYGEAELLYQKFDKILDQFYLTFILVHFMSSYSGHIYNIAIILYLYRLAGLSIFLVVGKEFLLLLFPNIFENFAILILLYSTFEKAQSTNEIYFLILIAAVLKIPQEVIIHVSRRIDLRFRNIAFLFANTIRSIFNLHPLKPLTKN